MTEDSFRGVAEWLIVAMNSVLHVLSQVGLLIWEDPPRAAIIAGVSIMALAIIGSVRARRNRRARGVLSDEFKRGLKANDVLMTAQINSRIRR